VRRIMVFYGTRPEAIKVAPLVAALKESPLFTPTVVVTAQHLEMLDQVNDFFGIKPDVDLDMMRPGQSLGRLTERVVGRLDPLMADERPDAVVVQGDTTTTFTGALTAFYHRIPVVHLEAGLRTGDAYSPFPEETNRRLTTTLARLHLAPTAGSRDNLLRESVPPGSILVTGNTVIDALMWANRAAARQPESYEPYGDGPIMVVTAHRRESWDGGMESIGRALSRIATREPDLRIVFPIHPNPVIRRSVLPHLDGHPNITVTEPLEYGAFARLLGRAHLALTDSGGIQEEAPSLGTPVLVMRDTTERPEAISAGTAALVGTDEDRIVSGVTGLLRSPSAYRRMAGAVNPYGDGRAAERAVAALAHLFGLGPSPEPFSPQPAGDSS
jgi:UDP-N-acetylglucosamine 2-epimerase (non-hydrolysing)